MARQVLVHKRFREFDRQLERATARALEETGRAVAAAARSTPTDYDIREILDSIDSSAASPGRRGLEVSVFASDWRALFFEKGTNAKRGRARSTRAKAVEGSRGVKPVRFLRKGLTAAFPTVIARLRRRMP